MHFKKKIKEDNNLPITSFDPYIKKKYTKHRVTNPIPIETKIFEDESTLLLAISSNN